MADQQAKVTSIEAIDAFRSDLIVYLSKSKNALDEVSEDVRRLRVWLEVEQTNYWQGEMRRRRRKLDEAQAELFSAKMATFTSATTLQEAAVVKARRGVQQVEDKLRNIRKWIQNFDSVVEPLARKLEGLRQFIGNDMPKGVDFLTRAQKTLESYAEVAAPKDITQLPKDPPPPTEDSPEE